MAQPLEQEEDGDRNGERERERERTKKRLGGKSTGREGVRAARDIEGGRKATRGACGPQQAGRAGDPDGQVERAGR